MVRLDTCLHFLNLLSFLLLWKAAEPFHPEWKSRIEPFYVIAGFLNAAAILMKPTALTVTLAFILYAILRRLRREAAIFLTCALAPVAVFLVAAQLKTDGMCWTHTVKWAAVEFSWAQLFHFLGKGLLPEAGWLVIGIGSTLWAKRLSLLLKCQLSLAVLSLWTLSRDGAAENYYMELLWVGLLVMGEGWASLNKTALPLGVKVRTLPVLPIKGWMTFIPSLVLLTGLLSYSRSPALPLPSVEVMEGKLKMLELYRGEGEHIALDADLPVMSGKRIWYQHSGILAIEKAGKWDPAPLLADIQAKKFSTIELYDLPKQYLISEKVEQAIRDNYKPVLRQYGRVWLAPK
jgi:hypothetical protein